MTHRLQINVPILAKVYICFIVVPYFSSWVKLTRENRSTFIKTKSKNSPLSLFFAELNPNTTHFAISYKNYEKLTAKNQK